MRYYLNLICILIQLLCLPSQDSNPDSIYRKLLTTTIRSKFIFVSFSSKERSPILSSFAFDEQFYSKTQTTTPIIDIDLVRTSNKPYIYGTKVVWDLHRSTQISSELAEIIQSDREVDCSYFGGNIS
jgi:hypothetical protein